jgi:hypothetical protein
MTRKMLAAGLDFPFIRHIFCFLVFVMLNISLEYFRVIRSPVS